MSEEPDDIVSFDENYARKLVENLGDTVTKVVPTKADIAGKNVWVYVVHTKSENAEDDTSSNAAYIVSSITGMHYQSTFFWQHIANKPYFEEEPTLELKSDFSSKNGGRNLLHYPPNEEG